MMNVCVSTESGLNEYQLTRIIEIAERFFSDPENKKKYEAWHLEQYGYLPND